MGRTVLLADNAGAVLSKRQAACLVKECQADDMRILLRLAQFGDGPGGTDLSAQGAVELTVTESWNKPRGKYTLITTFQETGLFYLFIPSLRALYIQERHIDSVLVYRILTPVEAQGTGYILWPEPAGGPAFCSLISPAHSVVLPDYGRAVGSVLR